MGHHSYPAAQLATTCTGFGMSTARDDGSSTIISLNGISCAGATSLMLL
jgi:hypothetical protein